MEVGVDAMTAPSGHYAASSFVGHFLDDLAKLPDGRSRFDNFDGSVQALTRRLDEAHVIRIIFGLVANIVRLVQICMVALVVDRNIEIDDVAVKQDSLVWDTVADNFIG